MAIAYWNLILAGRFKISRSMEQIFIGEYCSVHGFKLCIDLTFNPEYVF